jgi:PKD repeat protein
MKLKLAFCMLLLFALSSCYKETELPVVIAFDIEVEDDNYTMPVRITPENRTTGANFYRWTFEGGSPASSTQKQPGTITYSQAGTYRILLEAWNDGSSKEEEFIFTVYPNLRVDFEIEIPINNFAPVALQLTNTGSEAAGYEWHFEGAETTASTDREPQNIVYRNPGTHTITLTAFNGFERFSISKTIEVLPALVVDFEMIPSFESEDYETPFTANLLNKSISGITYLWTSSGGTISNNTSEHAELHITEAGTYTISLQVNNDKEIKTMTQELVIRPNSNLRQVNDIKFGVKQAENTIGCFFSMAKRRIFLSNEVRSADEPFINLVFYSTDITLQFCKFISPTVATIFDFYPMPLATATYFVNTQIDTKIDFTATDFNNMQNDLPLRNLDIKGNANDVWFSTVDLPYIILFETADGRKGAIKIKEAIRNGEESYILTDIKYQKESK